MFVKPFHAPVTSASPRVGYDPHGSRQRTGRPAPPGTVPRARAAELTRASGRPGSQAGVMAWRSVVVRILFVHGTSASGNAARGGPHRRHSHARVYLQFRPTPLERLPQLSDTPFAPLFPPESPAGAHFSANPGFAF